MVYCPELQLWFNAWWDRPQIYSMMFALNFRNKDDARKAFSILTDAGYVTGRFDADVVTYDDDRAMPYYNLYVVVPPHRTLELFQSRRRFKRPVELIYNQLPNQFVNFTGAHHLKCAPSIYSNPLF